jgi:hypothetical protein
LEEETSGKSSEEIERKERKKAERSLGRKN